MSAPTPRTDAALPHEDWSWVEADFARTLERELTEARRERDEAQAECAQLRKELADELEDSCRQGCNTGKAEQDYNGQIAGTLVTDSGALSVYAAQLRRLAALGRFRIVAEHGRMVVGYWPENDPLARPSRDAQDKGER